MDNSIDAYRELTASQLLSLNPQNNSSMMQLVVGYNEIIFVDTVFARFA